MPLVWDQAALQGLIDGEREEDLTLDYKAADALAKSDGKKREITKDVSAMANSAGGLVIYGIKERDDRPHLPEAIDPVDRGAFSKEWLEHVISNIRPRIADLVIHPVSLSSDSNHVAYVVEVPKGDTAHQAADCRYYRRYNFESVPMQDHEIRDVMARSKYPTIAPRLSLRPAPRSGPLIREGELLLAVDLHNEGQLVAHYVNALLDLPEDIIGDDESPSSYYIKPVDGVVYRRLQIANLDRDIVGVMPGLPGVPGMQDRSLYARRYAPILPGLGRWESFRLRARERDRERLAAAVIYWEVYADNAPKTTGRTLFGELRFVSPIERAS